MYVYIVQSTSVPTIYRGLCCLAIKLTVSRTELNLLFKKQFASTMKASGMVTKDDFMTAMEAVGIGAAGSSTDIGSNIMKHAQQAYVVYVHRFT